MKDFTEWTITYGDQSHWTNDLAEQTNSLNEWSHWMYNFIMNERWKDWIQYISEWLKKDHKKIKKAERGHL